MWILSPTSKLWHVSYPWNRSSKLFLICTVNVVDAKTSNRQIFRAAIYQFKEPLNIKSILFKPACSTNYISLVYPSFLHFPLHSTIIRLNNVHLRKSENLYWIYRIMIGPLKISGISIGQNYCTDIVTASRLWV